MKKKQLNNSLLLNKKIISNLKAESRVAVKGGESGIGCSNEHCVTYTQAIACLNSRHIDCKNEVTKNCV